MRNEMKTPKMTATMLVLTSLLLAGCQTRLDKTAELLKDPEVQVMAAEHPRATKKVFRVITDLERRLQEK